MPKKSSNSSAEVDPDLVAPKMAMDEIEEIHGADAVPPPPPPPMPVADIPPPPPPMPIAPPPPPTVTVIDTSGSMGMGAAMMNQQNFQQTQATAQYQAQASVGLAQTNIDQEIFQEQSKKEDEHWAKAFWRPAMGWLYMVICFMDFVGFPLLTIFLPIIFKPFGLVMPYQAWTSLTLSNGGLIHLAFGAILGVSAFTRGQEKIAGAK
jgi:hypothetical protein